MRPEKSEFLTSLVRLSSAITKLVRMHVDAMEHSSKAKLEMLPQKWDLERKEQQANDSQRVIASVRNAKRCRP